MIMKMRVTYWAKKVQEKVNIRKSLLEETWIPLVLTEEGEIAGSKTCA